MKNLTPVMLKIAAALALVASTTVNAAVSTWNGTTSVNWDLAGNWNPGIPNPGDDLTIADTTANNSVTLNDASHIVGLIQLGTTGTRNAAFTINGSATTTASTTLTVTNGVSSNYGAGIAGGNLIIKSPVIVQNDQTWTVTGTVPATTSDYGVVLTVGANGTQRPLTLNGTLTKTGNGEVVFIGQNVGNGNIVVNQGWLKLNAGSSTLVTVGGTGSITVNNSATFMIAKNSGTLSITKAINLNDGATFRLGGNSGTLQAVGSLITFNGNVPIIADFATLLLDFTNIWTGAINSTITGNGGTITLWNDDSGLSGSVNNSGTFKMRFGSNASASAAVAWALNNAAAYYEIYGAATNVNFGSLSGSSGILRNSNTNNQPATATVGSLNTSTTFGGTLSDNSGPMAVNKVGSGTLTLTGANTLSGGITVMNGAVLVQGAAASSGFGTVTVQAGASFGGSGTASGAVAVLAGGQIEADGGTGAPGLNVASLTLGSASTDSTTSSINLYAGGAITNGGSLTVNGTNIVNIPGAAPAVGVYNLITYVGGSIGGAGFGGFHLGALPFGVVAHLQDSGSALQLNVTAVTIQPGIWVGNVLSAWNLAGGLEWKGATSGSPQPYHDQDVVTFNDSASSFSVNVTANVTPASITVNNSTAYTFSGAGSIIGPAALVKDGPGTLIFANSNSYSGGTFMTNGVLQLGNGGTNGALAGDLLDNGSLILNRSDAAGSFAGIISGTGSVEQRGSGKFTLGGANTYTGVTTVSTGILATASGTALGDVVAGTTVAKGATLDVNSQALGAEPFSVSGAGVGGIGAIVNNGPADNTSATRFVTLTGPTTFGGAARWDVRDPSPSAASAGVGAYLVGNGNDLTKVSTNVVAFINAGDTALGNINILGGTLTFSRGTFMGDPAKTITVYPGATLQLHRTSEFVNNVLNKVVTMTNGTLAVESNGLTNQFAGPITLTGTNTFSLPAATGLNLQGAVSGNASVITVGTGALIISSNCTYTGGTTMGGGFLQVDGSLGTGANPLLITAPTVVGGIGTILDPVTIPTGSALTPGDSSVGTLTIRSTLVLSPGCSNVFEVNKDISANDAVNGLTSVTYGGTLVINNIGSTGYAPGDNFKLFNAGSYHGSFSAIVPATPALGLVWVTNNLAVNGTLSVAVLPTPVPLFALSASSLVSANVNVVFTAALDPNSAQDPTNYKLSAGNPNIVSATLLSPTNVVLALDAPLTNSSFTVNVKSVHDTAFVPNVVATTNVPGVSIGFLEADAVLITNGSAFAYGTNGLIKVYADGADIFNASDAFEFVWSYTTNDFDVRVMLQSLLITDPAAKAGLMARVPSDPNFVVSDDAFYMVAGFTADSTRNNNFVQYRETEGGTAVAPAAPRPGATYPTNWLRLKRSGAVFSGYCGSDGLTWTPMTTLDTTADGFPQTMRVGLAVTAHNAALTTEALFSNFSPTPPEQGLLTTVVSGAYLIISWQSTLTGAELDSTGSVTPPATWTPVPGSTLTNVVYVPFGATNTFFRLNNKQ